MADGSTRNTYDSAVVSSTPSTWGWLARPVAIALSSLGLVIFVAGITSFSIHGVDSGSRVLLMPAGSVILSLGVLLGIGIKISQREERKNALKAQRSANDVLDLTAEFAAIEISIGSNCSTEFSGDEDRQNPQESIFTRLPPRPPCSCQEDYDSARTIVPLPAVAPMLDNNDVLVELEDHSLFEIPPSYEEACAVYTEVGV